MSRKQKKMLIRIIIASILLIGVSFVPMETVGRYIVSLLGAQAAGLSVKEAANGAGLVLYLIPYFEAFERKLAAQEDYAGIERVVTGTRA